MNITQEAERLANTYSDAILRLSYQLSDKTTVSKQNAVNMAKQGQIADVGIAHRGDTEYLKSIPNGNENDNLGNLPAVSPEQSSMK